MSTINEDKLAMELYAFVGECVDISHKKRDWLTRQDRTNQIIFTLTRDVLPKLEKSRGPKIWLVVKIVATVLPYIIKEARKEIR